MSKLFVNPEFLGLLLLLGFLVLGYWKTLFWHSPKIKLSQTVFSTNSVSWKTSLKPFLFLLKIAALVCFIVALARPRSFQKSNFTSFKKGIDIVIATDVSGSMLATDLTPNRLEAIKEVASEFVQNRMNDRVGLVVYAGESYTRTPVTSDKMMVLQSIKEIQYDGMVLQDGTAIGVGLATAINRLKESPSKSKVIILLTDGVSNVGSLDPISAAEIAKELNIKVYTIGVGSNGTANMPYAKDVSGNLVYQKQKVEIDEDLMKKIAEITAGKYFRATSNKKLSEIYNEIDRLEKTKIEENQHIQFTEYFRYFITLGLFFLLSEFVLTRTYFKSIV